MYIQHNNSILFLSSRINQSTTLPGPPRLPTARRRQGTPKGKRLRRSPVRGHQALPAGAAPAPAGQLGVRGAAAGARRARAARRPPRAAREDHRDRTGGGRIRTYCKERFLQIL